MEDQPSINMIECKTSLSEGNIIDSSEKSIETWTINIKDRLPIARNKFNETTKKLEEESALIRDKISLHEKEYDNLILRRDSAITKESELVFQIERIRMEILNISDSIGGESEVLKKEHDELQNSYLSLKNNIEELDFLEIDTKAVIKQLLDEHADIADNINKLRLLKSEITIVSNNFEEAISTMVDDADNLKSAHEEFQNLKMKQDDILSLSSTVDTLEKIINKLQSTIKSHEQTYFSLFQEYTERNNNFKASSLPRQQAKQDYEKAIISKNIIKSAIENFKSNINRCTDINQISVI